MGRTPARAPPLTDHPTLSSARTAADIIEATVRREWWLANDGAEYPGEPPTEADVAQWSPGCPRAAQAEAREAVAAMGLIGPTATGSVWSDTPFAYGAGSPTDDPNEAIREVPLESWRWQAMGDPAARKAAVAELRESIGADIDFDAVLAILESNIAIVTRPRLVFAAGLHPDSRDADPVHGIAVWDLPKLHQRWMEVRETDPKAQHPLATLIRAWLKKPKNVMPFVPTKRASLPHLDRGTELSEAAQLPGFPDSQAVPGEQFNLPGVESVVNGCPSWMLTMFDRAGGESLSEGRGAPWPMRLFIGAILHLAVSHRNWHWRILRFPHLRIHETDEQGHPLCGIPSVESWLHPAGWSNYRRDWHKLPEALDAIRTQLSYIYRPGIGDVAMFFPSVIPRWKNDPMIEFSLRIPTAAAHGARIDWPRLCQYGTQSATLYRAYLSVSAFLDHSARKGNPITARIAAPILDGEGNRKRRKGGAIVRSTHDTEPNPAAQFVQSLTDADLAGMIGFNPGEKKHRYWTRRAFEILDSDGVIDLQREGRSWRIFGPGATDK